MAGSPLRDALLRGLNGPSRQLSSFRGRPLLINVWASWCGPCRVEMPSLERLAWGELASQLAVIGISTDDDPRAAQAFLQRSGATLSHYLDQRLEMETMLGARQLPTTVLVDGAGRVADTVVGAKPWDSPAAHAYIRRTLGLKAGPAAKPVKPAQPAQPGKA